MKKHILALGGLVWFLPVVGQPTLTQANICPVSGQNFLIKHTQFVNPGNAGAAQTWNLTSMAMSGSSVYNMVAPSATPYAATFTSTANVALASPGNSYSYYYGNSFLLQNAGFASPSGVIPYQNPEDLMHFPFSFGHTFSDAFSASYNMGTPTVRSGTCTVSYDGYGTLMLPSGTYTNVARIHLIESYSDTSQAGTHTFYSDQYIWYLPQNHYPIAGVSIFVSSVTGTMQSGYYLNMIVSGTTDTEPPSEIFTMYPNPTNHVFLLETSHVDVQEVAVFTSDGRKVISVPVAAGPVKPLTVVLPAEMQSGVYIVCLLKEQGILESRKLYVIK